MHTSAPKQKVTELKETEVSQELMIIKRVQVEHHPHVVELTESTKSAYKQVV